MFADFMLEGVWFSAMDSAHEHGFTFNEAISFLINCEDQKEINHYWQLSADPKSEQCGWLKDKYGLSWQVSPIEMEDMLNNGTDDQPRCTGRVGCCRRQRRTALGKTASSVVRLLHPRT